MLQRCYCWVSVVSYFMASLADLPLKIPYDPNQYFMSPSECRWCLQLRFLARFLVETDADASYMVVSQNRGTPI